MRLLESLSALGPRPSGPGPLDAPGVRESMMLSRRADAFLLIASYRESARHGVAGFVRDLYRYTLPWQIPRHSIRAEMHLRHGEGHFVLFAVGRRSWKRS